MNKLICIELKMEILSHLWDCTGCMFPRALKFYCLAFLSQFYSSKPDGICESLCVQMCKKCQCFVQHFRTTVVKSQPWQKMTHTIDVIHADDGNAAELCKGKGVVCWKRGTENRINLVLISESWMTVMFSIKVYNLPFVLASDPTQLLTSRPCAGADRLPRTTWALCWASRGIAMGAKVASREALIQLLLW